MSTQKNSSKTKSQLKKHFVGDEMSASFVHELSAAVMYSPSAKTKKPVKIVSKSKSVERALLERNMTYVGVIKFSKNKNTINEFEATIETLSEISSDLSNHAATRIAQLSAISVMGDRIDQINRENAEALDRLVNG